MERDCVSRCRVGLVLSWAKVYHIFFPGWPTFSKQFPLRISRRAHARESLFQKHSRAARQITRASIHVTRPDPRTLNRVTSYLSTRYFISRVTNRKDLIREMRMANFLVAIRCKTRFKAEFLTDDIFPSQHEILDSLYRELIRNQPFASSHALITWKACSIIPSDIINDIINAYARVWYLDNLLLYIWRLQNILFVLRKWIPRKSRVIVIKSMRAAKKSRRCVPWEKRAKVTVVDGEHFPEPCRLGRSTGSIFDPLDWIVF